MITPIIPLAPLLDSLFEEADAAALQSLMGGRPFYDLPSSCRVVGSYFGKLADIVARAPRLCRGCRAA